MRWLKHILGSLLALLLVLLAGVTLVYLLDDQQRRELLLYGVARTSDARLEINGPLVIDFSLSPSIQVTGLDFATASGAVALSAAELRIQADIVPLLSGKLVLREFLLRDSVIALKEQPDTDDQDDEPFRPQAPTVDNFRLENVVINYWQRHESVPLHVRIDALDMADATAGESVRLSSTGSVDGTPYQLEGEAGKLATLVASDQPYPLKLRFSLMDFVFFADGTVSDPHEVGKLDLAMRVEAPDVQGLLTLLHIEAPDLGALNSSYRLTGTLAVPEIHAIDAQLQREQVNIRVTGDVGNILAQEQVALAFEADVSDPTVIDWLLPAQSPRFTAVHTAGHFSMTNAGMTLEGTTLRATGPDGYYLDVSGDTRIVDAPQPLRDLRASLSVKAPDTAFIRQFVEAVPILGPLAATATVASADDVLAVRDLKLNVGNKQKVSLTAQGDIGHIQLAPALDVSKLDLQLGLAGSTAVAIGELVDIDLPRLGPVSMKAHYRGSLSRSRLSDLQIQAGSKGQLQVRGQGEIKLAALQGDQPLDALTLDLDFNAPSTASISAVTATDIPAMGQLQGTARVQGSGDSIGIPALDATISKGGDFHLAVNGSVAGLAPVRGMGLKVNMRARDLHTLGALFDKQLPAEGRLSLTGQISGGATRARLTGIALLGNTEVATDLTGEFTGKRPLITGKIEIPDLDVHEIGLHPERHVKQAAPPPDYEWEAHDTPVKETVPLFSTEPYDLSGLTLADLDIKASIDKLSSTTAALDNIYGHITIDNGRLALKPLRFTVDGDSIAINAVVDAAGATPSVTLTIDGTDIDMGQMLSYSADWPSPIKGLMTAEANLHSQGQTQAELAANLTGTIHLLAENGKVRKSDLSLVKIDVLGWALSNILSRNKEVNVGCAIATMEFKRGIGKTGLFVIDTPKTLIRIAGDVDFAKETMYIAVLPEAKARLFKTRQKPMEIYGPITNPTYELVSLTALTREATRTTLLAPLIVTTSILDNLKDLVSSPKEEKKGTCDQFIGGQSTGS